MHTEKFGQPWSNTQFNDNRNFQKNQPDYPKRKDSSDDHPLPQKNYQPQSSRYQNTGFLTSDDDFPISTQSHPTQSHHVQSHPTQSHPIQSHPIHVADSTQFYNNSSKTYQHPQPQYNAQQTPPQYNTQTAPQYQHHQLDHNKYLNQPQNQSHLNQSHLNQSQSSSYLNQNQTQPESKTRATAPKPIVTQPLPHWNTKENQRYPNQDTDDEDGDLSPITLELKLDQILTDPAEDPSASLNRTLSIGGYGTDTDAPKSGFLLSEDGPRETAPRPRNTQKTFESPYDSLQSAKRYQGYEDNQVQSQDQRFGPPLNNISPIRKQPPQNYVNIFQS